ncbi:MAG: HEAT repeat domain-containing protein [Candidatus Hodarchaeota archaeon]
MREPLSPIAINNALQTGEVSKEKALELLISLIERSEDAQIRSQSIEILEKLGVKDNRIFKVLENALVSDENAIVRTSAVKSIIRNFIENGLALLEWVIEHDKSPLVLQIIIDKFENTEDQRFKRLKQILDNWYSSFSEKLGIVPDESKFFLDVEALFAQNKKNYKIDPYSYKHFHRLTDTKGGEPWLLIKNKHVEILNFNYYNWKYIKENQDIIDTFSKLISLDVYLDSINRYRVDEHLVKEIPESIGRLTYLRRLILKGNEIQQIPLSIKSLKNLEQLDLSHNNILQIPPELKSFLNSLKYFKY